MHENLPEVHFHRPDLYVHQLRACEFLFAGFLLHGVTGLHRESLEFALIAVFQLFEEQSSGHALAFALSLCCINRRELHESHRLVSPLEKKPVFQFTELGRREVPRVLDERQIVQILVLLIEVDLTENLYSNAEGVVEDYREILAEDAQGSRSQVERDRSLT